MEQHYLLAPPASHSHSGIRTNVRIALLADRRLRGFGPLIGVSGNLEEKKTADNPSN